MSIQVFYYKKTTCKHLFAVLVLDLEEKGISIKSE